MRFLFVLGLMIAPQISFAQSPSLPEAVIKALGESAGLAGRHISEESFGTWIQVDPQSKEACLAKTSGVVNKTYMRCRNGYQALMRKSGDRLIVERYRNIPE